ncbi:hypothetical protein PG984_008035 [Apiospora sp. TS-2023a]
MSYQFEHVRRMSDPPMSSLDHLSQGDREWFYEQCLRCCKEMDPSTTMNDLKDGRYSANAAFWLGKLFENWNNSLQPLLPCPPYLSPIEGCVLVGTFKEDLPEGANTLAEWANSLRRRARDGYERQTDEARMAGSAVYMRMSAGGDGCHSIITEYLDAKLRRTPKEIVRFYDGATPNSQTCCQAIAAQDGYQLRMAVRWNIRLLVYLMRVRLYNKQYAKTSFVWHYKIADVFVHSTLADIAPSYTAADFKQPPLVRMVVSDLMKISFCPVTVATVAAAALPVAAVVGEKLTRSKPGPSTTASSALVPVALSGTAKEIEAFFVDTAAGVSEVADRLWALAAGDNVDNYLYVDLEGVNLCRNGSAFVVDVFTLQAAAFTTKGARRDLSIQDILESAERKKAFFDVRNDSDAMFYHYGVRLRGVEDIQLMHNASRPKGYRNTLSGLSRPGIFSSSLKTGGSFDVFNVRPLSPEIISYCVGDVYYLSRLRQRWWGVLSDEWKQKVIEETEARVVKSQQDNFRPHSPDKTRSPWEDEWYWVPLDELKTPVGDYPGSRSIWAKSKGVVEEAS